MQLLIKNFNISDSVKAKLEATAILEGHENVHAKFRLFIGKNFYEILFLSFLKFYLNKSEKMLNTEDWTKLLRLKPINMAILTSTIEPSLSIS